LAEEENGIPRAGASGTAWLYVRVAARAVAIALWTAPLVCARVVSLPLAAVASGVERAIRRWLFKTWAKGIMAIIGMRSRVEGPPPKPPFFMVSNHLTHLDVILVGSVLGCLFVSKAEVKQWPLVGFVTRIMNTIFIDRDNPRDTARVNAMIGQALDAGCGVHVFAEGGVSQDGSLQPFKPALLEPAVARGHPVHYATITYRTPDACPLASELLIWRRGVSYARNIVEVLKLPEFYATLTFARAPIADTDRKRLAERLTKATRNLFTPTP